MVISMDANFGLVHKRSRGAPISVSRHGTRYFIDDEEVYKFVDSHSASYRKDSPTVRLIILLSLS